MSKPKTTVTPIYDEMLKAIDECYRKDEDEQISDPSERLKYYARIAQNSDFLRNLMKVRLLGEHSKNSTGRRFAANERLNEPLVKTMQ